MKTKTKYEENIERISNDFPIVRRFFTAVYHVIATENLRGFHTFCVINNLNTSNMARLTKEPHRQFPLNLLTLMVEKYNFSAHWLVTGKGPLKNND
ncbi:hypothetical protein BCF58_0256 [Chryseobacterium defluvii]|uniref:Bacteriophage CI repressor-like protein n=2 Tax=Chryseobacterium defluvii TaxID=160396 RepID=A0A495SMV3_9FLAO|nr:hypothetical protein BCF58_0256 [Chryseobacterium defluvii]